MEVAPAEAANTGDAQSVDDPPSVRFTWTIENFTRLNTKKLYSEIFFVGGYKWRVSIFPKGNNVDHLSMYLDVADSATLPYGWSRYAQFSLAVVNQIHSKFSARKDIKHQFNARESDWGFTSFMPILMLSELYDPARGYLVNDTIVVEADVAVCRVGDYLVNDTVIVSADVSVRCLQDSKKETGSVGLKNCKAEQDGHKESSQPPSLGNYSKSVVDNAPPGKIRFLSYWVSPEASLVLRRIHNRYKGTFAKFSMTSVLVQTLFLESFASFIESMSTTKICEVNEEALRVAVKDFEQVGLDLSWLKQRLDQAKMVNKRSELLASIDSYEKTIEHTRAKLHELKEGLAKAKAEAEVSVRDLPKSLGVNDSFFEGLLSFSKS